MVDEAASISATEVMFQLCMTLMEPSTSSSAANFCQEPGLAAKQASLRKKLKEKSKKAGSGSCFLPMYYIRSSEIGLCFLLERHFGQASSAGQMKHHGIATPVMSHDA